jgi:hypothetical protein
MTEHIIKPVQTKRSKEGTKQKEAALKKVIKKHLEDNGWFVFGIQQGMGSYPGIADLYAIQCGVGVWIEIKLPTPRSKQNQNQEIFEKNINNHHGNYLVARSIEDVDNFQKTLWPF